MDRNLGDLEAEATSNGLTIPAGSGKTEVENLLRDFYWAKNHPGEKMLLQVAPMLAEKFNKLTEEKQASIWKSPKWVAQLKLNGCRLIMHVGADRNRFTTRGKSVTDFLFGESTDNLPFHRDLKLLDLKDTILDGEIVSPFAVVDTGRVVTRKPLQAAVAVVNSSPDVGAAIQKKYGPMQYHVFDVVRFRGQDTTEFPYSDRLEILAEIFKVINANTAAANIIKSVPVVKDNKEEYFKQLVEAGEEGVVLKDTTARYYLGGRPTSLLKVKRFEELDAFVVGFVPGKEGKALEDVVGGLLFAVIDSKTGKQTIVGCISGLPMELRRAATLQGAPLKAPSTKAEFVYTERGELVPPKSGTRTINYRLNPEFLGKVAVVQGQEFTPRSCRFAHCRFAVAYMSNGKFHPWREDKRQSECLEDISVIAEKAGLVEA